MGNNPNKAGNSTELNDAMETIEVSSSDAFLFRNPVEQHESVISSLEKKLGEEEGEPTPKKKDKEPLGTEERIQAKLNESEKARKKPVKDPEGEGEEEDDLLEGEEDEKDEDLEKKEKQDDPDTDEGGDDEDYIDLSRDQIARIFGLEEDDLKIDEEGNVLFQTKVNGKEEFVPLDEMRRSYQFEKHNQQKSQKLSDAIKEFESHSQQRLQKLDTDLQDVAALLTFFEKQVESAYPQEAMDRLRQSDPGKWAAVSQDLANYKNALEGIKAEARLKYQEAQQSQSAAIAQKRQEFLKQQVELLTDPVQGIPGWSDRKKAGESFEAMKKGIVEKYGFTKEEAEAIADHRVIRLAIDALKAAETKDTKETAKKLVKRLPRIMTPGGKGSKGKRDAAQKNTEAAQKKRIMREKNSISSIADVLVDRIQM